MKFQKITLNVILILCSGIVDAQTNQHISVDSMNRQTVEIIFYNLENLFDCVNDIGKADDEFTPNGIRKWTPYKYNTKLKMLSQSILASNHWSFPDLIAVAEIENRDVLNDLSKQTLLKKIGYRILHQESFDRRGIDLGLLYNPLQFKLVEFQAYKTAIGNGVFSRDLLYAAFETPIDTLHFFVCHWPSRYGGKQKSDPNRSLASNLLLSKIELLTQSYKRPRVIIMGDFNDEPADESIQQVVNYKCPNVKLINLMSNLKSKGSLKYRGQWYMFDQFMLSSSIEGVNECEVCEMPFLKIRDEKYLGDKPFRTYNGFKYIGGYSDHFPIRLVIKSVK